jgi:hypothetical protein
MVTRRGSSMRRRLQPWGLRRLFFVGSLFASAEAVRRGLREPNEASPCAAWPSRQLARRARAEVGKDVHTAPFLAVLGGVGQIMEIVGGPASRGLRRSDANALVHPPCTPGSGRRRHLRLPSERGREREFFGHYWRVADEHEL